MPSELTKIAHPFLYEINTWPWLAAISKTEGKTIDLGSVPARYWDQIADLGFDGVWLMGVWQRSPAGYHDRVEQRRFACQLRGRSSRLATLRRGRFSLLRTRLRRR